jgi:predicted MFS family arabinose efflux permease
VTGNALLAILGISGFAANIAIRVPDPMVPLIARGLDVSIASAALLATFYTLPYALAQPFLGPLGDTLGKARVIGWCLAVLTVSLAASAVAPDYPTLVACRIVSGLSGGGLIPLSIAMIADRFPVAERQLALSRYLLAVIVGQISGSPMAGLLSDWLGWRPVFAVAAAIAGLATVAVMLTLKAREGVNRPPFSLAAAVGSYRTLVANATARACYLAVFAEGLCIYGILPYIAALLEGRGAGGVREAGFVVAGLGIGGIVFSVAAGPLIHRLPRATIMRAGGFVIFAGLVAAGSSPTWPLEMAAFTATGLGFYMLHTGLQTEVTEVMPAARGSAVALHAFFLFFGMAIGPIAWGAALAWLGPGLATFGFASAMLAVTLAVTARFAARNRTAGG